MPIKNLPSHLRPREKGMIHGLEILSDIELFAIFIKSGTKSQDALDISKSLFEKYQTLNNISNSSWKNLQEIIGIGKVKALEIRALFEIFRRLGNSKMILQIKSDQDAADFSNQILKQSNNEKFLIILLDKQDNILYSKTIYHGTNKYISIDPKEIISLALKHDAKKLYCTHNHPSGNIKPSKSDLEVTKSLKYCANLFEIEFCGHIIVDQKENWYVIKI